jgi:hypothetical protein
VEAKAAFEKGQAQMLGILNAFVETAERGFKLQEERAESMMQSACSAVETSSKAGGDQRGFFFFFAGWVTLFLFCSFVSLFYHLSVCFPAADFTETFAEVRNYRLFVTIVVMMMLLLLLLLLLMMMMIMTITSLRFIALLWPLNPTLNRKWNRSSSRWHVTCDL